jgi:hypothetical protein
MTKTAHWLESRRREFAAREILAVVLGTLGVVLSALALGVGLARLGLYEKIPAGVLVAWGLVGCAIVAGIVVHRRRSRTLRTSSLAGTVEQMGGLRRGSVLVVSVGESRGSESLLQAADANVYHWLNTNGVNALRQVRSRGNRFVWLGAAVAMIGASALTMTKPTSPDGSSFWRVDHTLASRRVVLLEVDRLSVRRGDSVEAVITAVGREEAVLWVRAPGEAWRSTMLALDSAGRARVTLGPLDSDRYLRAAVGQNQSDVVHVQVAVPAFLAELAMYARFPSYLERVDEAVLSGDSVLLPAGTRLIVNGQATVDLARVAWSVSGDSVARPLSVDGSQFSGNTLVTQSGRWTLDVTPEGGFALDDEQPSLTVTLVPDSAPVIVVSLPGVDTVAPPSLLQPLVVDVRDDHGVTLVQVVSRRAGARESQEGGRLDTLFLPESRADRAVLSWVLDLRDRGFLPGDTAYYRVRAFDNAPQRHLAESREYALLMPTAAQLRQAVRDAAAQLAADADSLAREQQALSQNTENLAASRERAERDPGRRTANNEQGLGFQDAQRASEIAEQQESLSERAQELERELNDLSKALWDAGNTDPELHEQLAQLQELMEKAMTPELRDALEKLKGALERLDPEAVREALQQLADAQQQLDEQLQRNQELFKRAALEGAMSTLAQDAKELSSKQEDWNQEAQSGQQSDSALSNAETALGGEAEQLERQLEQLQQAMEQAQQSGSVEQAQNQAGQAAQQMNRAAQQAQSGQRQGAQQSGQQASQQLQQLSQQLNEQLQDMRGDWRQEVLEQMDVALSETAELARRQQETAARIEQGESGADVRGEQAAIREGVDRIVERLQDAAGKNALVSPNLSSALGYSKVRMTDALTQFEQPTPNTRQAAELAAQALDGLNAVAAALLRNRGDVESSSSGSGMAEAMQQMAEMAAQQEALNGQTGGVLPLIPQGGEELLQQLQSFAEQQQAIGQELERMGAEEGLPGANEELAKEALEIAEQLRTGTLDEATLERQEQLFRRLLDAGRSLRSDEEDDRTERKSETGAQDLLRVPPQLDPNMGDGVRYPYPDWEQLRRFAPEERRIILNYFRRLNTGRP